MGIQSQQVRERNQGVIEYASGGTKILELGRGYFNREIRLELSGQLTCADSNNTDAKTKNGDEWACVKEIRVKANDTDIIRSISGKDLYWLNRYQYGQNITSGLTNGVTNPTFKSVAFLPFWSMNSKSSFDTVMDTSRLSRFTIEIDWEPHTAINADASGWTVDPTITVNTLESYFTTQPEKPVPLILQRIFKSTVSPTGVNSKYQFQLPVGVMYRGFIINTSVSGVDDPACVNSIELTSGSTVFSQKSWLMSKEIERMYLSLPEAINRKSTSSNEKAWVMMDLASDGYLTESLDAFFFSELLLKFDVTKACDINIYAYQLIPPRKG